MKIKVKQLVDISIEKEKKILEYKYRNIYDEKVKRNIELDNLYESVLILQSYLDQNHRDIIIQPELNKAYLDTNRIYNKIKIHAIIELNNILDILTQFHNGVEFIEYYKFKKEVFEELINKLINTIKNEKQN